MMKFGRYKTGKCPQSNEEATEKNRGLNSNWLWNRSYVSYLPKNNNGTLVIRIERHLIVQRGEFQKSIIMV